MNDRRVPQRYQEELLASVTALLESIECEPPPPPAPPANEGEDDEDDDEGDDD